ncbi:MAG: MBL fold metallo-hydrolase [Candidatus Nanohaloarchaea archaeon]
MEYNGIEICWDGHASLRFLDHGFTVAVDPYSAVSPDFEADIVLLSHADEGHYDREKLEKVCGPRTVVVAPVSMEHLDIPCNDTEFLEEGETVDIYNVEIEAVPMYNEQHERGEGIGYRFVMGRNSFYVAGDTGFIDEVSQLEERVGVAFLPIDGRFTMSIEDAVKMAKRMKPSVVVPYHYGEPFFENTNPRPLKAALEDVNIDCAVLEQD